MNDGPICFECGEELRLIDTEAGRDDVQEPELRCGCPEKWAHICCEPGEWCFP